MPILSALWVWNRVISALSRSFWCTQQHDFWRLIWKFMQTHLKTKNRNLPECNKLPSSGHTSWESSNPSFALFSIWNSIKNLRIIIIKKKKFFQYTLVIQSKSHYENEAYWWNVRTTAFGIFPSGNPVWKKGTKLPTYTLIQTKNWLILISILWKLPSISLKHMCILNSNSAGMTGFYTIFQKEKQ